MLGFFRRMTKSKVGGVVAFLLLGMIALAFAAGDVTGLGGGASGMSSKTVAEVGNKDVPETELVQRVKQALQGLQQQQPTADMTGLIGAGGVEQLLDQIVTARAFEAFAAEQGMVVSKRAVDGELASTPAFRGPDGKFSQTAYEGALQQNRITDAQVRNDIARERLIQLLTAPANAGVRVGTQLALPYASLLLERRSGAIGFIPASAVPAGPAPTDAELQAFYRSNLARYTIPERRVVRYAVVSPEIVKAQATPTDAEIAAAYRTNAARFAASQKRAAQSVVVLDQATANSIAAKVKAGTSIADAARAAGLEARTFAAADKATLGGQAGQPVADALFAAPADGVVGPIRSAGSFVIAKVTGIEQVAAKTLEQARPELLSDLTKEKQQTVMTGLNDAIDKAAGEGATFDEIVRDQKLSPQKTPAVTQNGLDPMNPAARAIPSLTPILQAGFGSEQGDSPQIVPIGPDGSFALVALESVTPAAPRPLAEIRDDVAKAVIAQRSVATARKIADQVAAKAAGTGQLASAMASTGLKLPAIKTVNEPRATLAANPQGAEPALALLFAMAPNSAKVLAAPQNAGWLVIKLDTIVTGDARSNPQTVTAAQQDMSRVAGGEMAQQFGRAIRNQIGVKINPTGIKRAKDELSGRTPDAQN